MHCSRVFRSSVRSDLLPSSPGRRPSGATQGECGSTRSMKWGVGPGGRVSHRGGCPAEISPRWAHPRRHVAGAGPLSGEVARCVILNWSHVLSAPRHACNRYGNNGARCMSHFSLGRFSRARFSQARFSQARFSRSSWPSCPPEGTGEYPSAALLGAPLVTAAAASRRIRRRIWPPDWPAGPRMSFPAR